MADTKSNDKDLQKEFEELKNQFSEMMQVLKNNGEEKLSDIQDLGTASLEEVSERIRQNPVSSLLLAFGAGYILSKILKND